jgi:hypothetical protein
MKVYAYYQAIPTADQSEEFACANWWKTSWTANGWEPVMLNRSHAQGSTLYNKMQQKLAQSGISQQWLQARIAWFHARFTRWCALHAAGGGWMSDYDVLNLRLTPEMAKRAMEKTLLINSGPAYLFYASKDHCTNAIKRFLMEDLVEDGKVRSEIDILGAEPELGTLIEQVCHVHSRGDRKRPERMQFIFNNEPVDAVE